MARYPTREEILNLNPHIDEKELEEARKTLRTLREGKTRRAGYNLASPLDRRRVFAGEGDRIDSRTIHLGRFRR